MGKLSFSYLNNQIWMDSYHHTMNSAYVSYWLPYILLSWPQYHTADPRSVQLIQVLCSWSQRCAAAPRAMQLVPKLCSWFQYYGTGPRTVQLGPLRGSRAQYCAIDSNAVHLSPVLHYWLEEGCVSTESSTKLWSVTFPAAYQVSTNDFFLFEYLCAPQLLYLAWSFLIVPSIILSV